MLVLVIVAVFSAIAVPRFSQSTNRYSADAAARRIEADFKLASNRARITSSTLTIVFDITNDKYSIAGLADLNQTISSYTADLGEAPYQADLISAVFADGSQISFNGYGVPSGAGTVILQVGSNRRTITIAADTGEVTIQ
jgi:Tfp pilus assembly protein FimT